MALSACARFFRDNLRTSVIENFVENIEKNAPMIRDWEAVEQLDDAPSSELDGNQFCDAPTRFNVSGATGFCGAKPG
ncbi:MAG TPA: hypothetical protein VE715_12445 [Blastocatellia bacterium]|nr:hypothetical protein [Blastocatellia bacterium]